MSDQSGPAKVVGGTVPKEKKPFKAFKEADRTHALAEDGANKFQSKSVHKKEKGAKGGGGKFGSRKGGIEGKAKREEDIAHNHKEQEALKRKRKAASNENYDTMLQAKQLWEEARARSVSKETRTKKINEIMALIEGKVHDVIFQHDSTRVLQTCLKHGSDDCRAKLFTELKDHTIEIAKSKYGSFLIPKMLAYGSKAQREQIISGFYGQVRRLVKHRIAAPVIAVTYVDFATAEQRAKMEQEFYGPQFEVFKVAGKGGTTLAGIFAAYPDKKEYIMRHLNEALMPLLEKGICSHNIVHHALLDYVLHADPEAPALKELLDSVKDLLVEMVHTPDGAKLVARSVWLADTKIRKTIVKSLKPYAVKIATEEYGYVALLAVIDSVDDTVLVNKMVIAPLVADIENLAADKYGQKVLMHLLAPRSPKYLIPDTIKFLEIGDGNPHSKKAADVRRKELSKAFLPGMLMHISANAPTMVAIGHTSQMVFEALISAEYGSPGLAESIVAVAATARDGAISDVELSGTDRSLLGNNVGHRLAKGLLKADDPKLRDPNPKLAAAFGEALYDVIKGSCATWAKTNRAAFVLLALCESKACAGVANYVKAEVLEAADELAKMTAQVGTVKLVELVTEGGIQGSGKGKERATKNANPRAKKATTNIQIKADAPKKTGKKK